MKNECRREDNTKESDSEAIRAVRAREKMKKLGEGTESSLQICGQKEVGWCVCVWLRGTETGT